MSVLFTNTRTRWPHNERQIEILHEAKPIAVFTISNLLCGKLAWLSDGAWVLRFTSHRNCEVKRKTQAPPKNQSD